MLKFVLGAVAAITLSVSAQAEATEQDSLNITALASQASEADRMELARELVRISGAETAMSETMFVMLPTVRPALAADNPGATNEQLDEAMAIIEGAMVGAMPEMLEAAAGVYARRFTAEELRQINAFYRTDVGSKLARELQPMMAESSAQGEQIAVRAIDAVTPDIRAVFN